MIYRIFAQPQLCNWLVLRSSDREWMADWGFRVIILCSQEPHLPRATNRISLTEHLLTKYLLEMNWPFLITIILLDDHILYCFIFVNTSMEGKDPRDDHGLTRNNWAELFSSSLLLRIISFLTKSFQSFLFKIISLQNKVMSVFPWYQLRPPPCHLCWAGAGPWETWDNGMMK